MSSLPLPTILSTLLFILVVAMAPSFLERLRSRPSVKSEAELAQEKEDLQKVVTEAVSAAINTPDFTKAVAVYLASQLEPTLKSTLDISAVETRLLAANAQLTEHIDEISQQTTAKFRSLSGLVESTTKDNATKISAVELAVSQITDSLVELGNNVKAVEEIVSAPDTSLLTIHGEKLDTLSKGLEALHTPITSAISAQDTQLATIAGDLAALKSLSSELGSLKAEHEAGANAGLAGLDLLSTKSDAVLGATEGLATTLAELKASIDTSDILAGIKTSNDSHTRNAETLATIKATTELNVPVLADLQAQVGGITSLVSTLSAADITPEILSEAKASNAAHATLLAEIKSSHPEILSAVKASNEALAAHSTSLIELKAANDATVPINVAGVTSLAAIEDQVKSLASELATQSTAVNEIKSIISVPAPVAEKTDITGLEANVEKIITTLETHGSGITELKSITSAPAPVAEKLDLTNLETSLQTIIGTLETHTGSIGEIKSVVATPAPLPEKVDLASLESSVQNLATTLAEVKAVVEIPAPAAKEIDLTPLHGSIEKLNGTLDSHTGALTELKSIAAAPAPAAQNLDLSSLEQAIEKLSVSVSEIKAIPAETTTEKVDLSALEASIENVSAMLAEVKAIVEVPAPAAEKVDLSSLETTFNSLSTALETNINHLTEIKATLATPVPAEKVDLSTVEAQLTEIKAAIVPAEKIDLSPISASVEKLNATLNTHTGHLTDIKSSLATPAAAAEKVDLSTVESNLEALKTEVSQTALKVAGIETAAILAEVQSVKGLVEGLPKPVEGKDEEILAQVASVKALVEAIPAPVAVTVKDEEILTEVKGVKALIEAIPAPVSATVVKDDEILTQVASVKALLESPAVPVLDKEILEEVKSVKALVEAIPAPVAATVVKDDEILTQVASVKSLIEAIPTPVAPAPVKDTEILTELNTIKSLVEALPPHDAKADDILAQVKQVRTVVEGNVLVIGSVVDEVKKEGAKLVELKSLLEKQKVVNGVNGKVEPKKENGVKVAVEEVAEEGGVSVVA